MVAILILLFFVCLILFIWLIQNKDYPATSYSFTDYPVTKGEIGEYRTYCSLRHYERNGARFISNCYLPCANGETTEVDLIMLYHSGIYVFETKNYSGWIFGDDKCRTWTQTLPAGKQGIVKNHFYNPVMQNRTHINCLRRVVKNYNIPVYSIIVFSNQSTLKKITISSPDTVVLNLNEINNAVSRFNRGVCLSEDRIKQLYAILIQYANVSNDVKHQHVRDRMKHRL